MPDQAITTPTQDPLLETLTIKKTVFRNRIMSTSHACGLEEGGMPTEAYRAYHVEKARGGIALSMFGGSSNVDRDSPNIFRQLNVGSDAIIPHLQRFSEAMHAEGAALMCQITHLGRRADPYAQDWLPAIGPSAVRETLHRAIPREMDDYDIERVVNAYAAAARRCWEGGLDGIETLAAGHMIGQFLSPKTNLRTDRFGGSLENRIRFGLMVHEAIRKAVGDDFLVGMRFVVDEGIDGALKAEDCIAAAEILKREGAVDFFNAIYGSMDTARALAEENMPGMGTRIAPWVIAVGAFRREIGLPVFHAARISDIATARYAVSEGLVDMAGMTRAQIADPYLVTKLARGEEHLIRPCVGATHCQSPYRPKCLHNAATGRELALPHVIRPTTGPRRRAVVVGAGPAGLEAARVLAERGHDVSVYEAGAEAGGQVRIAAEGKWRRDIIGLVDWRVAELERLGVTVSYNAYMEAADVLALEPDLVIVATGGLPQTEFGDGADLVVPSWDIIGRQVPPAAEVLIFDGTGRHPAPLAAERAHAAGSQIHYFSIDGFLAQELTYAERTRWKQEFIRMGITPILEHRLVKVARAGNRFVASMLDELTHNLHEIEVDQVIVEMGTVPMDDLFEGLRPHAGNRGVTDIPALLASKPQPRRGEGFELHRIGDAAGSRNVHAAVLDALRLAHVC